MKRSILPGLVCGALTAACLATTPSAARASVVWLLNNVPLSDGGTINGSFTVDQYGDLSAFHVTTSSGTVLGGTDYTTSLNANLVNGDDLVIFNNPNPAYDGALNLDFAHSLALSGPNTLEGGVGGPSFECGGFETATFGCPGGDSIRYVSDTSFSISGTPEPASWITLILGMALVGACLRTRRQPAVSIA